MEQHTITIPNYLWHRARELSGNTQPRALLLEWVGMGYELYVGRLPADEPNGDASKTADHHLDSIADRRRALDLLPDLLGDKAFDLAYPAAIDKFGDESLMLDYFEDHVANRGLKSARSKLMQWYRDNGGDVKDR